MPVSKPSSSPPLRIGLVRRGYSAAGGAESYLRGFAEAAVCAGHEVILFASPEWANWRFGEKIEVFGKTPRAFSEALAELHPPEKCDVLFSLERVSACDIFRAGDGVHRAWLERRARFENPLKRLFLRLNPKHRALIALEKASLLGARKIIANSEMVRGEIERFYGSEIAGKVHVVYNGIDPAKWRQPTVSREDFRKTLQLSAQEKVVAFIGSGWARKGLRFAISATEKVGATLLVSGRGALRNPPSHVRLLGSSLPVVDVLHAADAFILPTIYDPFSNATLEALAAGLPIITTAANGVGEILDLETDGSVIDAPDNISALAAALERWIPDPQTSARQDHAAAFSQTRNFQETLRIIES